MLHNLPFTEVGLLPKDLSKMTIKEWSLKKHETKLEDIERIRKHILHNWQQHNHDFISGNMTSEKIIEELKNIDTKSNIKFIPNFEGAHFSNAKWNSLIIYNNKVTNAINRWFPEKSEASAGNNLSFIEQFKKPETFKNNLETILIKDRFKVAESNPKILLSTFIRNNYKMVNGNQPVNNFPAPVAKWIYSDYGKRHRYQKNMNILDTSMGYAGRLAGALALDCNYHTSDMQINYYGTDVNTSISERYSQIVSFWKKEVNSRCKLSLFNSAIPAEKLLEDKVMQNIQGKIDIAFTSPPYFNKEKYSNEGNQSYLNYPIYNSNNASCWKNNFLKPMIESIHSMLRSDGEFWINIANIRSGKKVIPLEKDTIEIAVTSGFHLVKKYKMLMSHRVNTNTTLSSSRGNYITYKGNFYKFEPIFVFKKGGM